MLSHLIIIVMKGALQEDGDPWPQLWNQRPIFGQGADSSRSDSRILQDDTVVDVSDVLGRLLCLWALQPQQVQDLGG